MENIAHKLTVVQNLSLLNRSLRIVLGALMIGLPIIQLVATNSTIGWHAYSMLLAIYPLMTGMLGWCPVCQMFNFHSCGLSDKNQCGTLPYQFDAALGHHPQANHDYDHSLTGSHH